MKNPNILENLMIGVAVLASVLGTTKEALAKALEKNNLNKDNTELFDLLKKNNFDYSGSKNIKNYFKPEYWKFLGIDDKQEGTSGSDFNIPENNSKFNGGIEKVFEELMSCKSSSQVAAFVDGLDLNKYIDLLEIITSKKSDINKKYSSNIEKKKNAQQKFALEVYSAFFPGSKAEANDVKFLTTIDRDYFDNLGGKQKMYQPCIYVEGPDGIIKIWSCHYDENGRPMSDGRKTVKSNKGGKDNWKGEETSNSKQIESKYKDDLDKQVADFAKQTTMSGLIDRQNKANKLVENAPYDQKNPNLPKNLIEIQKQIKQVDVINAKAKTYMVQVGRYLTTNKLSEENLKEIQGYLTKITNDIKYIKEEPDYKKLKSDADNFAKAKDDKEKSVLAIKKNVSDMNLRYQPDQPKSLEKWLAAANSLVLSPYFDKEDKDSELLLQHIEGAKQYLVELKNTNKEENLSESIDQDNTQSQKVKLTKEEKDLLKQQKNFQSDHMKNFYKPAEKAFRSFMMSGYDFSKMEKNNLSIIMKSILNDGDLTKFIEDYKLNPDNFRSISKIREFISKYSNRTSGDFTLKYESSEELFYSHIAGDSKYGVDDYSKAEKIEIITNFNDLMSILSQ